VIDGRTGEIYAERGMHTPTPPASLTKIFTSIEAIESAPDEYQIVTSDADLVDWEATQVGFKPGEVFTLRDMIYGMLLPSGNDAARAVARSLGEQQGDDPAQAVDRFVTRLNQRIHDMGLSDTNLVNPDGWGVPGHVSSAYDLAAFTMYALKYPRFVDAISTRDYTLSSGDYELTNTNKRLGEQDDLIGGKTGYDDTAGYCLMQVARRGSDVMIAVTLDGVAPDTWYDDNKTLLDFGFDQAALRRETGSGVTGEIARYLDPDAAVIQAMASSAASVGAPVALSSLQADSVPLPVLSQPIPPVLAAVSVPVEKPAQSVTVAAPGPGRGLKGLGLALAVAVVIASVRALSAWQGQRPPASSPPAAD
ncbi:MAG: D-alanyl-D-alanine carboxypeptidase family protein, partial [Thermomicrobiales bacterium]